jgi:hypothetical protein
LVLVVQLLLLVQLQEVAGRHHLVQQYPLVVAVAVDRVQELVLELLVVLVVAEEA